MDCDIFYSEPISLYDIRGERKYSMPISELQAIIDRYGSTRIVKKGSILLYQSEVPRRAFVVKKGLLRAYAITNSGEERTIALHDKGDIVPLSWVFGKTSTTLFYYDALTDSEVIALPKAELVQAAKQNPKLMSEILALTMNEYTSLLLRITALEQSSAAEKIALTLYYLLFRHGEEIKPDIYNIHIKMTQSMLASLVGLTRESTAVNLKLLKRKDIVSYSNFNYTVNKANLERFVGEDSFKNALAPEDAL
jgi:CRP-like cAMP-binding protein